MKSIFPFLGLCLLLMVAGCATTGARGGVSVCCSSCGKVCLPEVEETQSTHHCYGQECQEVCIPAIRLPWEDCCTPLRCGKVRTVKVLKKYEYTCPDCTVKWSVSGCSSSDPAKAKADEKRDQDPSSDDAGEADSARYPPLPGWETASARTPTGLPLSRL